MNTLFLGVFVDVCIFLFCAQDFSVFADMKVRWSEGHFVGKRCKLNINELECIDEIGFHFIFIQLCILNNLAFEPPPPRESFNQKKSFT